MTLTAYNASGSFLGQLHATSQFAMGAIQGTLSLPGMRYVAFNYTNTQFGFYGIDDLTFEPDANHAPEPDANRVPEPGSIGLMGIALAALSTWRKVRRRRASGS